MYYGWPENTKGSPVQSLAVPGQEPAPPGARRGCLTLDEALNAIRAMQAHSEVPGVGYFGAVDLYLDPLAMHASIRRECGSADAAM